MEIRDVAQPLLGVIVGFLLGYFATIGHDRRRDKKRHRQFATALVYDIRMKLASLSQLSTSLEKSNRVVFTNDFGLDLFRRAQADLAQLGGDAYLHASAFYAQLEQANYLRSEIARWATSLLAMREDDPRELLVVYETQRNRAQRALAAAAKSGTSYGSRALESLKRHSEPKALTADLPERDYTEEEKEALGEKGT